MQTRVSGVMTNAPYILNVDCDMFGNDPKLALHAMCLFLNPNSQKKVAFVQFPQVFYDALKDDPFGNQLVVSFKVMYQLIYIKYNYSIKKTKSF